MKSTAGEIGKGKEKWIFNFVTVTFYTDGSKKEKVIKRNLSKNDIEMVRILVDSNR